MISRSNAVKIFISVNIVSWLLLLVVNLLNFLGWNNYPALGVPVYLKGLLLNLFLAFIFFYYRITVGQLRDDTFINLLTRLVVTGCTTVLVSVLMRFLVFLLGENLLAQHAEVSTIFYHVNIGLITIFLTQTFFVWKILILYQKSRGLLTFWYFFEYCLLASLLLNFFQTNTFGPVFLGLFGILSLYGFILSVNLRWVAYLNFKEKWQGILLIILVVLFSLYFMYTLWDYVLDRARSVDIFANVYMLAMFTFIFIYALFSILVILFNLPTTSVFEQKIEELLNFQKLTQSLQMGDSETKVYETLIEGTVKATLAEAAWLEVTDDKGNIQSFINRNISRSQTQAIKEYLNAKNGHRQLTVPLMKNLKKKSGFTDSMLIPYKSLLTVPLLFQNKHYGMLTLLKEEKDGFDNENAETVTVFARLAGVAIENFRLVSNALENERYKEALNIAKKVQQSLLPTCTNLSDQFELSIFSHASDEVGGDYYDFYKMADTQTAIIIGDVSGKGTSAAFHMAQMKGVFQSLIEMNLHPDEFLRHANNALSRCLEKNQFITASYFLIDTEFHSIQYARAGHCPTLYFSFRDNEVYYLQDKGLGLGILRSEDYSLHISKQEIIYYSGDAMLLYTDGIVEAKNTGGEEYGYERLLHFMRTHIQQPAEQFTHLLVTEIQQFCGSENLDDDYTAVFLKFI
ncbi:SpoIIE family protein phosphatase [Rhodocytophaga aerolata]|uniref:SpoIIE family protein phosphatase n=1 Tax=Rhodocytophaga aerolata TaxID=455078 RepID=A0ABT8R9C4_9BACT|nr:SpoIIE family protein phosphatase [Rhodocytophaga aerolata]MDO1448564.1 SpoIIE family protein phosphatase [Rhodocytophaga aerolata]